MRAGALLIALVAVSGCISTDVSGREIQKETEVVDRTLPFPSDGTLHLRNFSGDVRITGTGGREIEIHAVRRAERSLLDSISLEITSSRSTIAIEANRRAAGFRETGNNVVDTTFEIRVPEGARLDIDVFSSDLDVNDVRGKQRLKTFSGEIVVRGAAGTVDAHTFSSSIEIDATGAGHAPDIKAETFSGPIRTRLAAAARGSFRFDSFSGRLDSDLPAVVHSSRKRHLTGELPGGGVGGSVSLKTFSGNVTLTH